MHADTPTQIPGIELESEIKIPGSAVTIFLETSDQEMYNVSAHTKFDIIPDSNTPSAVDNMTIMDEGLRDGDAILVQEYTFESDDIADRDMGDTDQADDATGSDVADIQEEVNPIHLEDNFI